MALEPLFDKESQNESDFKIEKTDKSEIDFENDVSLKINDIDIYLNKFTDEFLKETIMGMLKSIKTSKYGVKEFKNIKIEINNDD